MQKKIGVFPESKGKSMTKLMTGDLNVTAWVTAMCTVTA